MKKTLCIIFTLSLMLSVFFCIPVYAETFPIAWRHRSETKNNGVIQVVVYASQYAPYDGSIDYESPESLIQSQNVYINIFIRNNSDDNVLINGLGYKLFIEDPSGLYASYVKDAIDYELVRGDFNMVQSGNDGWYWINGNSDFTYEYKPIIPSHTALSATFKLKLPTFSDPGTGEFYNRQFALISRIQISDYTVAVTDYIPLGSHRDVTDAINDISSYISSDSGIPLLHSDLQELINILKSNQTTNQGISTDSNTLKTQSDSVHSQEASYYAQNSQAIANTGLSNYQFDSNASSGIGGVRGDFIDVWNSLSGWNSIYIFSLTLGLALTILRHSPSAISSAIKRKRYNNNE